jgi:hypothetical protein
MLLLQSNTSAPTVESTTDSGAAATPGILDIEQAVKSVRHVLDSWRQNQIIVTRWNFNDL